MARKLWIVSIISGAIVVNYLFIFAMMPFFLQMVNVGIQGAETDDFKFFRYAMQSSPLWFFLLVPAVVGIISIVLVLREPERK